MASLERVVETIAEIARRPRQVSFEEIEQIMSQLKLLGYRVVARPTTHGYQYTVGNRIIRVKKNPRGPMKKAYVDDFLDAMIDLGLYNEE